MMKRRVVICIFILAVIVGSVIWRTCSDKEVDITNKMSNCISGNSLSLSSLNIAVEWDTMYIIDPYDSEINSLNISIDDASRNDIIRHSSVDTECTVVFSSDNKLTAYAFIKRNVFDFTKTPKKVYHKHDVINLQE